jgi:hypothetical protein
VAINTAQRAALHKNHVTKSGPVNGTQTLKRMNFPFHNKLHIAANSKKLIESPILAEIWTFVLRAKAVASTQAHAKMRKHFLKVEFIQPKTS